MKEAEGVRVEEDKQPERLRDHAWFIAFAPKDHPRIAVACLIEHGGHGGSAAAPPVHDVMQKFFELYPAPEQQAAPDMTGNRVPDMTGASGARMVASKEDRP